MCGEHLYSFACHAASSGSSPRVRGTLKKENLYWGSTGIIPACAGNTFRGLTTSCGRRDHPRVCGEHDCGDGVKIVVRGSSPRVRGTLAVVAHHDGYVGIIPACAGNTNSADNVQKAVRDHPRVCGEHYAYDSADITGLGSSPRVRGTRPTCWTPKTIAGIIPACAGNTRAVSRSIAASRDHPRVCGEHRQIQLVEIVHLGSSPRVRGTLHFLVDDSHGFGIIPACAGNTIRSRVMILWRRDHPRVCGEHQERILECP